MSCSQCNQANSNANSSTVNADCQCVPSPSGAAYCDPRFANLPKANQINLIGSSGECLAQFPIGKCGLIFFDEFGYATITDAPAQNLPSLVQYLTDENNPDGLARQDGKLIEGIPPVFDYLMVLEEACGVGSCCGKPEWKKWRGPKNSTGYVFWNGTGFEFGGINTNGVVTSAILEKLTEGIIPAYPDTTVPDEVGSKTQGFLCPDSDDLYFVDTDAIAHPLNPGRVKGFVVYRETGACDSEIIPQVAGLCDIANPPCVARPEPTQIVGCSSDGDVAATMDTEALAEGYCNKVIVSDGDGAPWRNGAIGGTFFPGNYGTLRQDLAASGSFSVTVSSASLTAAAGYQLPSGTTHVIVHVRAVLRKSTSERSNLSVAAGGVGVVEASAYSWDNATQDQNIATATAVVPVSGSGSIALDVNHSNVTSSTYDLTVNLAGVFACAEVES